MAKIKADMLSSAIQKELTVYSTDIMTGIKKSAKSNIRKMAKQTKRQRFKRDTGRFRNAIATRKLWESRNGIEMQWYVKPPHYRLTHLLEKGHQTRNGGRTIAYRFVEPAAAKAQQDYMDEVEAIAKNGG